VTEGRTTLSFAVSFRPLPFAVSFRRFVSPFRFAVSVRRFRFAAQSEHSVRRSYRFTAIRARTSASCFARMQLRFTSLDRAPSVPRVRSKKTISDDSAALVKTQREICFWPLHSLGNCKGSVRNRLACGRWAKWTVWSARIGMRLTRIAHNGLHPSKWTSWRRRREETRDGAPDPGEHHRADGLLRGAQGAG
jgi:hypothetical protein